MKRTLIILLTLTFTAANFLYAQSRDSEFVGKKTTVKTVDGYIKNAFGLDLGVGGTSYNSAWWWSDASNAFAFDVGFRYLHNFSPYFGIDFFKIKPSVAIKSEGDVSYFGFNGQLMFGARGYSPTFTKSGMCGFGAFRMGGGVLASSFSRSSSDYNNNYNSNTSGFGSGLCYEFEVGLHISRVFFIAFCYNHQGGSITFENNDHKNEMDISGGYSAFRMGFNFGRVR